MELGRRKWEWRSPPLPGEDPACLNTYLTCTSTRILGDKVASWGPRSWLQPKCRCPPTPAAWRLYLFFFFCSSVIFPKGGCKCVGRTRTQLPADIQSNSSLAGAGLRLESKLLSHPGAHGENEGPCSPGSPVCVKIHQPKHTCTHKGTHIQVQIRAFPCVWACDWRL